MNILFFYIHFKDEKKAGFDIIKCNILIKRIICLDTNNRNGDSYEIINGNDSELQFSGIYAPCDRKVY